MRVGFTAEVIDPNAHRPLVPPTLASRMPASYAGGAWSELPTGIGRLLLSALVDTGRWSRSLPRLTNLPRSASCVSSMRESWPTTRTGQSLP